jgi:protein-S-isoprenylcysteine O-methyltransferase Ste14
LSVVEGGVTKARDHAGVIAPPPLLALGALAIGIVTEQALGGPWLAFPDWTRGVSAALGAAALALALGAVRELRRFRTAVEPWRPTTAIVSTGVYRLTRNPIYLGFVLLYAGVAIWAESLLAIALLAPLLIVLDVGVIRREERYLSAKFGAAYDDYRARVRRWI